MKIFRNDHGHFTPWDPPISFPDAANRSPDHGPRTTDRSTLGTLTGWWNGVTTGDFDGDGRLDIVASNWGRNTPYEQYVKDGLRLYYGDLADNGAVVPVEAYFDAKSVRILPWRDLDTVGRMLPWVRERFPTSAAYGEATIEQILGERLKAASQLRANWLDTTVFLNRGDHFEVRSFPIEAQFTPAFAVCVGDLDGDGREDVFLSQNFFDVEEGTSRYDGGRSLWLKGDGKGDFRAVNGQESGLLIYGEQRGAALCDYDGDGRVDLAVAQNAAATKLYHNETAKPGLRVRLQGPPGNPVGIGGVLRLAFGQKLGPAREIHGGSGYWSQDSAVQVLSTPEPPTQLHIRWPGGRDQVLAIPAGALEIAVAHDGTVKKLR